jgi:hypothetical protein
VAIVYDFGSAEFNDAVRAAGREAFSNALAAGLAVFYLDDGGINVMERAVRRKLRNPGRAWRDPRSEGGHIAEYKGRYL